jgi:hypothetical protein
MRTIQSGLLASVAVLVAFAAQAADVPATKTAPAVKPVTACLAMGNNFFTLPGTETCLGFSGYVRARNTGVQTFESRTTTPFVADATARLNVDVRQNTSYGVLRGYARFNGQRSTTASTTKNFITIGQAYMSLGDIVSAGYMDSAFLGFNNGTTIITTDDGGNSYLTDTSDQRVGVTNTLRSTMSLGGGTTVTASLEDPALRSLKTASTISDEGVSQYPDVVVNLKGKIDQLSWNGAAAYHQLYGLVDGEIAGYALQGYAKYQLTSDTALLGQATYAYGATSYLGVKTLIISDMLKSSATTGDITDAYIATGYNSLLGVQQKIGPGTASLIGTYGVTNSAAAANAGVEQTLMQGELSYDWVPTDNFHVIPAISLTSLDTYTESTGVTAPTNTTTVQLLLRRDF